MTEYIHSKIQADFTLDATNGESIQKHAIEMFGHYGVIVVKNSISPAIQEIILKTALHFYKQIANKLNIILPETNDLEELDKYVIELEKSDRLASVQAQKLISQSRGILDFTTHSLVLDLCSKLLTINADCLIFEGFGGFVPNIPSNTSRLYTYHAESHWLPMRKNFINCWAPLFRKKQLNAGTMFVKPFSHKKIHEFYTYQGFDGVDSGDYYTQYEVPDSSEFSETAINSDPGDIVLFHQNLLHRSEVNKSNEVGYLFINRYFDLSKDLTISANLNLRPYSAEANRLGRKIHRKG